MSFNYTCYVYSNEIQTNFFMDANTMNPDQTAPKGAVWSGVILFAISANKLISTLAYERADDKNQEWQVYTLT